MNWSWVARLLFVKERPALQPRSERREKKTKTKPNQFHNSSRFSGRKSCWSWIAFTYRGNVIALGRRLLLSFFSIDWFISLAAPIPLLNQFKEEKKSTALSLFCFVEEELMDWFGLVCFFGRSHCRQAGHNPPIQHNPQSISSPSTAPLQASFIN